MHYRLKNHHGLYISWWLSSLFSTYPTPAFSFKMNPTFLFAMAIIVNAVFIHGQGGSTSGVITKPCERLDKATCQARQDCLWERGIVPSMCCDDDDVY